MHIATGYTLMDINLTVVLELTMSQQNRASRCNKQFIGTPSQCFQCRDIKEVSIKPTIGSGVSKDPTQISVLKRHRS